MGFIEPSFDWLIPGILLVAAAIAVVFCFVSLEPLVPIVGASALGAAAVVAAVLQLLFPALNGVPTDEYVAELDAVYGVDVDDVAELEFPAERPDEFEVFGTTGATRVEGGSVSRLEVTLSWDGDEFVLLSGDGQELQPLEAASNG